MIRLDPVTLGDRAHELAVKRLHMLLAAFDPAFELPAMEGPSVVRESATALAQYASWPGAAGAGFIWFRQTEQSATLTDDDVAALHETALAALARERISSKEPVPTAWLAALAGTRASYVRRLALRGVELSRSSMSDRRTFVTPASARAWLNARWRKEVDARQRKEATKRT